MIVIDGHQSKQDLNSFANLEDVLVKVMEDDGMRGRIVTDVLVDNEPFSEIYPHHAEDVETDSFHNLEVKTSSFEEMASQVAGELFTVIKIMQSGAAGVSTLLRRGDVAEGLESLQDLLDVTRNFLSTVSVLHQRFPLEQQEFQNSAAESLDKLLAEMSDVMGEQDWLLLSDLLEYEFLPACENWLKVLAALTDDIALAKVA